MAASKRPVKNKDAHVELHVRKTKPTFSAGWKRCKNSSGAKLDFWYRYKKGDWSGGGPGGFQAKVGNGKKTVHLTLKAYAFWVESAPKSHGFRITGLSSKPDKNGQLSLNGNAPNHRQILDKATSVVSSGSYAISLAHKNSNGKITSNIICDPGWRNTGGGTGFNRSRPKRRRRPRARK